MLSTRGVADLLGVTPGRISKALWDGRLDRPANRFSGAFAWSERDVRRAAWVLLRRDLTEAEEREMKGAEQ